MSGFNDREHQKLIDVLSEIETLINRFYERTCAQSEILESEDLDALDHSLDERQVIIGQVDTLYQELALLTKPYTPAELKLEAGDPKRVRIIELQEKIQKVMFKSQEKNRENEEKARALMRHYSSEGRKQSMSRKSINMYNKAGSQFMPSGDYIDKKQ